MHWIVVTIKPNQSNRAERNLIAQNIHCYFPKIYLTKDDKQISKNLFPGYSFVKLESWNQLRSVSATRGVSKILSFNSKIPTLPNSIIESIEDKLEAINSSREQKTIKKDDDVIINTKLFDGMKAKVVDILEKKGSHIVLLQIMSHPQTIWFNMDDIQVQTDSIEDYISL